MDDGPLEPLKKRATKKRKTLLTGNILTESDATLTKLVMIDSKCLNRTWVGSQTINQSKPRLLNSGLKKTFQIVYL